MIFNDDIFQAGFERLMLPLDGEQRSWVVLASQFMNAVTSIHLIDSIFLSLQI